MSLAKEQTSVIRAENGKGWECQRVGVPVPKENEVLIRVHNVSVGSNLRSTKSLDEDGKPVQSFPYYGCAGVVVAVGKSVGVRKHESKEDMSSELSPMKVLSEIRSNSSPYADLCLEPLLVGDRVCLQTRFPCGKCDSCESKTMFACSNVQKTQRDCEGGNCLAEYVCVPRRSVYRLQTASGMSMSDASLLEAVATSFRAIKAMQPVSDCVLVMGCGRIGLFAVGIVRAVYNPSTMISIDENPVRLAASKAIGADFVIDSSKSLDWVEDVQKLTRKQHSVSVLIETPSNISAVNVQQMVKRLRNTKRACVVSLANGSVSDYTKALDGLDVCVVSVPNPYSSWVHSERLLSASMVKIAPTVSHAFPLCRAPHAIDLVTSGQSEQVMLDALNWPAPVTSPIRYTQFHVPSSSDERNALVKALTISLSDAFDNVEVSYGVDENVDLRDWGIASGGLSHSSAASSIVELGCIPNLLQPRRHTTRFDLRQILSRCKLLRKGTLAIGAGAADSALVGKNAELMPNLYYDDKLVNATKYAAVNQEERKGVVHYTPYCDSYAKISPQPDNVSIGLMANLFVGSGSWTNEGKTDDPPLHIKVSSRKKGGSALDFTALVQRGCQAYLSQQRPECPSPSAKESGEGLIALKPCVPQLGLGGTFRVYKGQVKAHVMPDFVSCEMDEPTCFEWLEYFHMSEENPVTCLSTIVSGDPTVAQDGDTGLNIRCMHTHFFSPGNDVDGGHYHNDVAGVEACRTLKCGCTKPGNTKDVGDACAYEAYFYCASQYFRVNAN